MRKKQVALYLSQEDHKKIKAIAEMQGISLNAIYETHTKAVISCYENDKVKKK